MSLRDIIRNKIINDMIRSVQPAIKWKLLIVDGKGLRILNSTCKSIEILEENITAIEDINNKRQPYPNMDAIYFVAPTETSLKRIMDDFTPGKQCYNAAHIFFVSTLDDALFEKLKKSHATQHIKCIKELHIDFIALEQQVFTLEQPLSIFPLYNPESKEAQINELTRIAKRLLSLLVTIDQNPYIRFGNPESSVNTSERFANILQSEIDKYGKLDPDFEELKTKKRATIVILDRGFDMISPIIHEFTYQAMMNDLLAIEGGKYIFKSEGSATTDETGQVNNCVNLDESDPILNLLRHWHFSEAVDYIRVNFDKFLKENKAAAAALGGNESGESNMKQMKDTIAALPVFQEMKAKYSIHINICQECKSLFGKRKLDSVASFEQDISTGLTVDGRVPRNAQIDLVPLLLEPAISNYDKVRMLMIYIIAFEGIPDMERRLLLEKARLSSAETQAITNLSIMNVKLASNSANKKDRYSYWGSHALDQKVKKEESGIFDLSRFVPLTKRVMEDLCQNDLPKLSFPWTVDPPAQVQEKMSVFAKAAAALRGNKEALVPTDGNIPFSLRTTRPKWVKKTVQGDTNASTAQEGNSNASAIKAGPPIIIFTLGGITFSEIRSAYQVSKSMNRTILIGGTAVYNPTQMVDILKEINQQNALSTKVGSAMASNTTLFAGDLGLNILQIPNPEDKKPVKEVKEEKKSNFFKRK